MTQDDRLVYPETLDEASVALRGASGDDESAYIHVERLLRAAAELGETDPHKVSGFIREHLIPRCLAEPDEGESRHAIRAHRLRELLTWWLNALEEDLLLIVRAELLPDVLSAIRASPTRAALYCLASIGYRSEAVVKALREVGSRSDKVGHEALRLLLGLEPSDEDVSWVSTRIADTLAADRTDEMLSAASRLHDTRWLPALADSAMAAEQPLFALARISWLGAEAPGDEALQDAVWESILRVVEKRPDHLRWLLFGGGVARRCNSATVISSLTARSQAIQPPEEVHVRRWADRVREVVSARQLSGWRSVSGEAVLRMLQPLITSNSGPESVGMTAEGHAKEDAIDTALCSGSAGVLDLLEVALQGETNPYMSAHVMNAFAVLSFATLPDTARTILSTFRGTARRENSNVQLVLFFAASHLATSSNSLDSLTRTLDSEGTVDGHPFRAPVAAAVEQATWLARSGASGVTPVLLQAAATGSTLAQIIAVRSLSRLLRTDNVERAKVIPVLRAVAGDSSRQPYVRMDALDAVVSSAQANVSDDDTDIHGLLTSLLSHDDENLRSVAVSSVITLGQLERHRETVESLARAGGTHGAFISGRLAAHAPDRYATTAADLLRTGSDDISHALLSGFEGAPATRLPDPMVEALIARIRRDESMRTANPPLFFDLATLAPGRLLAEHWDQVFHQWMPDSREALAASVPDAVSHEPHRRSEAEEMLLLLLTDGAFMVRRAAARALSRVQRERLEQWCAEGMAGSSIKRRMMAAEAARWLDADATDTMDNALLRTALRDRERIVREAAQQSRVAMRQRQWATELLESIAAPRSDSNEWVLSAYAAGRAIGLIGDDTDAVTLRDMSVDDRIPPNVRYWIGAVAKDVEKQWRKTIEKWPQASFPWRGALEQVEGTLAIDGTKHAVQLSLWLKRRTSPYEVTSWGGVALVSEDSVMHTFNALNAAAVDVEIAGRPTARVLVVESSGQRLVLVGNGAYPEKPVDAD